MDINFKKIRAKGDAQENPESGPAFLSFRTDVLNSEPNIAIIKAPHGRSSKEVSMHPLMVDKIVQLIPQQYVKPKEEKTELVTEVDI